MLEFTDDYLIGVPEIDAEHKHLFDLIKEINKIVNGGVDLTIAASKIKNGLSDYIKLHFSYEEAYMEKIFIVLIFIIKYVIILNLFLGGRYIYW